MRTWLTSRNAAGRLVATLLCAPVLCGAILAGTALTDALLTDALLTDALLTDALLTDALLTDTVLAAGQADQAQDVLAQLRKALGGDAKLTAIKTLTAEGTYRRVMGENETNGDLELLFVLPDKFQRIEQFALPTGMPGPRIATTLNGTEAWMGPLGPVPGGMQFRFGGPGGGPGGPGAGPGGAGAQGQRFDPLPRVRADYWRTALAFLPGTAATSALTFSYVGKAESPDGQAEVLEAKGEGNFVARVFVNADSHLPVMLIYMDRDPTRMRMITSQRVPNETDEARRARLEEERKKREAAGPPPPPPMVEISWFFADHKKVDGVMLPHRITQQTGDKPVQEWEIKKYKINAPVDLEQFKRKTSN